MYVKLFNSSLHKKSVLLACALFLISGTIWAQNIQVSGKVVDTDNFPLAGVSVSIYGSRQIVSTRGDGTYSISVPADGRLSFAMIGMVTQVVQVNNRSQIDVMLLEDATQLEDVVVVAFGTQKKENLSGAVSVVNIEKTLESRSVPDVGRALQGATPGLLITTQSGAIGGNPTIRIRSSYVSMDQGGADPLILVDNVEVPNLSFVNPNDIESISTLKDAASTAILGARAANGAILITTKKGVKNSKISVRYSNNFSWGTKINVPVHSRPDLELEYSWLQRNGANDRNGTAMTQEMTNIGPVKYHPDMFSKVKAYYDQYGFGKGFGSEMVEGRDFEKSPLGGFYFYRGWDIENEYYRKWAPQQGHDLSVGGSTDIVTYNISVGYMNQDGILQQFHDYYKRMNSAANVSVKVNKYVTLRSGFIFTKTSQAMPFNFGDNATYDPAYYLYRWFSTFPSGTYKGIDTRNGLYEQRLAAKNPTIEENWYNRLNLGTTVNIAKGLTANFDYTYNMTDWAKKTIGGIPQGYNTFNGLSAGQEFDDLMNPAAPAFRLDRDYVRQDESKNVRNAYNANITYDQLFGKHHIKAMVGSNTEDAEYKMSWTRRDNVNDYNLPELNLAGGTLTLGADHTWWSTVGFFGRINYEYDNRYLIELNFRRDAASKFRDGMRWASHPSGSVAWRISEENFWIPVKPYVNSFKVRASYGTVGNQAVPSGLYYPTITQGTNSGDTNLRYWLTNGTVANWVGGLTNSLTPSAGGPAMVNPDLTWEQRTKLDFGVDLRFYKDKFGLTFDWYKEVSSNLITQGEELPSSVGASAPRVNFGEITTKGFEIELTFNHAFQNGLHVYATGQLFDYKGVVTKFASSDPLYSASYYEGKVMGEIWGYRVERLFQNDDFVWENGAIKTVVVDGKTIHQLANLNPAYQVLFQPGGSGLRTSPGDVMFKDLNGDGVITWGTNRLSDLGDRTVIGNQQPRYMYSIRFGASWKGFDFDAFFQGVGKRDYWATGNMVLPGWMASEANFSHTLDYWTETNTNAFFPRPFDMANGTTEAARFNYQPSDRYLLNMAYLRCKTLTLGYTVPQNITKKIMVNRLRAYFTGENLFTFHNLGDIVIDPEIAWTSGGTENDARAYGRSYPYRRTFSFGVQIDF